MKATRAPRCVLVTGASSGIGAALVHRLATRGDRVAIVARRADRLDAIATMITEAGGEPPRVFVADLAQPGEARRVGLAVLDDLGHVDVVVNNAGGGAAGTIWKTGDSATARAAFEINYWAPLALLAVIVPPMIERRHGVIVNVTSLAQVMTWPMMGPYAATKAALASATETTRLELAPAGVHVIEVIPGPVDTAIQAETALVPGFTEATRRAPLGDPDELAARIVAALDHPRRRIIYPRPLAAAYLFPGLTRRYIERIARAVDVTADDRVLTSGSAGDDTARAARDAWEADRD